MATRLNGIFTPMLVPLDERGDINEEELRRFINWLIQNGVHGLYPNGSTGEFTRLTVAERQRIVRITCDEVKGRVPILAGAAEANVKETIAACELYHSLGATAVAIVSPFYYRLSAESVYAHFREIALNSPIDVTLYNIPMFASPIDVPTIQRLAEFEKIIGIKDSSGDVAFMMRMIAAVRPLRPDFTFLTGWDCVLVPNAITGKPGYYPLGSLSNRQGRVIGDNLAGKDSVSPPVVGSFVVKLFDVCLCGAGLTLKKALEEGFDAISVRMCQLDRAHFYPTKELMYLELVVDRSTRQVLVIQGVGSKGDATVGRINAVAALLSRKPRVEDISNLELAYSPPFSSAMDIVNALGNVADNLLDGRMHPIGCEVFAETWEKIEKGEVCLIDCRARADAKVYEEKYPGIWKGIPQDELLRRMDELPKDKPIVLICNTGVRSYEAQLNLRAMGHTDNVTVFGGVAMLKHWGMDI